MTMKVLILGAGAVGGYFEALLHERGVHVTLLVREERAVYSKKQGLNVRSQLGDLTVFPEVITSLKSTDVFQLVIISCKSYALEDAIKLLSTLQRSTYILPLLNGLSHYQKLAAQFGENFVLGGYAHLSTALDSEGNILHLNDLQVLSLGVLLPQQESFIRFAERFFSRMSHSYPTQATSGGYLAKADFYFGSGRCYLSYGRYYGKYCRTARRRKANQESLRNQL